MVPEPGDARLDAVLFNDVWPSGSLVHEYEAQRSRPVVTDPRKRVREGMLRPFDLLRAGTLIRHDPHKLARAIEQTIRALGPAQTDSTDASAKASV